VNNRKVLDGVMEAISIPVERRVTVLRAFDKLDKFDWGEIEKLLGEGREDVSGDYTPGAKLTSGQIYDLKRFWEFAGRIASAYFPDAARFLNTPTAEQQYDQVRGGFSFLGKNDQVTEGIEELIDIHKICCAAGYVKLEYDPKPEAVRVDPSVVRGLEYYTGPVFEAELTFEIKDDKGRPVRFGSVGGGGRYDGLVSRFRGEPVPATGFSIGVSRLQAALTVLGKLDSKAEYGPVVVTVFDRDRVADYQRMVQRLREANIRAELYLGNPKNIGNQLKYADKRNAPCVIIQGGDEKATGDVLIKDLIVGAELAKLEKGRDEYLQKQAQAQSKVPQGKLIEAVRDVLARHHVTWH